jgi:hypothetical protein
MDEKKYLIRDVNAQGLLIWLNENFIKDNDKPFNRNDVTFYIKRGHIPEYLGGNEIVIIPKKHRTVKLYNVLANDINKTFEE